ncbi:cytochrome c oxidase subunit 4 [Ornithinimicrobium sp. Y1847]|uniref:aa3-type cytochrome oxidase subunit IV n=1 Tax=unclassified Ornithinimicrobium TaxID=2615080 RepID=UPI003B675A2B
MKAEAKLFAYLVPFFLLVGGIYTYFTDEWVGIMGLFLTAALCGFVAWFFWLSGKNVDPRPEDNLEGEIADQSGDYGHFAPYSWWPLWLGLSTSVVVLGVGVGWWLVVVAAPFLIISIVGWTMEFFHGEKAV